MHSSATSAFDTFRSLHFAPDAPLLLANAWDAASARIVEASGARAVATTSAGIAWALGRPDGNALTRDESISAIRRITSAVSVPVTADLELGYGGSAAEVGETVAAALEAGAVGINLEDGTLSPNAFADRVRAARDAADRAEVPLFINARIDVVLAGLVSPKARVTETLSRAARYIDAGADGVFVPGVTEPGVIHQLVDGIDAPVNVMVGAGSPTVSRLAGLGVARISLGSGIAQAVYAVAERAASELMLQGTYESVTEGLEYGKLNELLLERKPTSPATA